MPTDTLVSEVMTTNVVTLRPDQSFEEAADTLAEHSIGAAPVVDADGKVVGLLRDEDLIVSEGNLHAPTWFNFLGAEFPMPGENKRFEEELKRMVAATVNDLMATEFRTASPDDTLATVASQMHDADTTHMPVVDGDGKLVGIVARGDIVRHLADTT
jgi:CBS-domain-containing membrane protein